MTFNLTNIKTVEKLVDFWNWANYSTEIKGYAQNGKVHYRVVLKGKNE